MTNGINHAVNRLVGEALRADAFGVNVPCIGLCSWKYIQSAFNINNNATCRSQYNIMSYSSTNSRIEKIQRKSIISRARNNDAITIEEGRAKQLNQTQESSSFLMKYVRYYIFLYYLKVSGYIYNNRRTEINRQIELIFVTYICLLVRNK